jgi:hypothetical protein
MKWFVLCLALNACFAGTALAHGQGAVAAPKAPKLLTPDSGFQLSQPVNGWTFVWQAPAGANAPEKYELWVQAKASKKPLLDLLVDKPAYTFIRAAQTGGGDWFWKVRTFSGNQYGPWSEERPFRVIAVPNPTTNGDPVERPEVPAGTPGGETHVGDPGNASAPGIDPKEREKYLLARIRKKQSDSQAFYQHSLRVGVARSRTQSGRASGYVDTRRTMTYGSQRFTLYSMRNIAREAIPGTPRYELLQDAIRAMIERNDAEWDLIQLFMQEGRNSEAVGHAQQLARIEPGEPGNPSRAEVFLAEVEFKEAEALYAESQEKGDKHKEKAAIERLWDLHRRHYQPATDALIALDKL